jgi:SAM-dependent methyltransferase
VRTNHPPEAAVPEPAPRFDRASVRADWDRADWDRAAYDTFQRSGGDYYRLAFFGPAQVAACGDVEGARVLDLGCGAGYLSRALAARGARVLGLDLSPAMVAHARTHERERRLGIDHAVMDAADAARGLRPESFDLVVSCLALQDMPDPAAAIAGAWRSLRPGGRFVPQVTHPFSDTPFREWERERDGAKRWLKVDRYFERGAFTFEWRGERLPYDFRTSGLHVPLAQWFDWFLEAGFRLRRYLEPAPTAAALAAHPDLEDAARVPYFALFDLERPA